MLNMNFEEWCIVILYNQSIDDICSITPNETIQYGIIQRMLLDYQMIMNNWICESIQGQYC